MRLAPRPLVVACLLLAAALAGAGPASAHTAGVGPVTETPSCAGAQTSAPDGLVADAHPVILIHGWNGSPMAATRTALEAQMTPGWQFLLFDYSPSADQWASSAQVAGCLAEYIKAVSDAHLNAMGDGVVYLVGHSMGGLAARYATAEPDVTWRVGGVVTLDTPHTGSPWGNTTFSWLAGFAAALPGLPLPADQTSARTCLAMHGSGHTLPDGCGPSAPFLPVTTPIHSIAGLATVERTYFGFHAYDIPLAGDSIVPLESQLGYLQSASGSTRGIRNTLDTIECRGTDGSIIQAVGIALPGWQGRVAAALGQLAADSSALDAIQDQTTNVALAALLAANLTLSCSHVGITTDPEAISSTAAALRDMADRRANAGEGITLGGDGSIGPVPAGAPGADVIAYLTAELGPPRVVDADTACGPGAIPGSYLQWGGLGVMLFTVSEGDLTTPQPEYLAGWTLNAPAQGVRTTNRLAPGVTVAEMAEMAPTMTGSEWLAPTAWLWDDGAPMSDALLAFTTGGSGDDVVTALAGGQWCGE